jgi:hypothetical protein
MSKLIVIAIGIANAAIFLAASVFIVAGDGATSNSAYMVWGLGFSWITIFLIQSLRLSVRKDNSAAIALSLSALPIGFAITLLSIYAKEGYRQYKPVARELTSLCAATKQKIFSNVSTPVRSVAFDWQEGSLPPELTEFKFDSRFNLSEARDGPPLLSSDFLYSQNRCCWAEGRPLKGEGKFITQKNPPSGDYSAVPELTADVRVDFTATREKTPDKNSLLTRVGIIVWDQRTNVKLSEMTYYYDRATGKGCGPTPSHIVSVGDFIAKSTGNLPYKQERMN